MKEQNDFFKDLYGDSYGRLYGYVLRMVQDVSQAEDIVQEVYCIGYQKEEALKKHPNPIGWLYRTAQNKIRKYQVKQNKVTVGLESIMESSIQETYGMAELHEAIRTILTEEETQVLYQYYLEGYSGKELADRLGITENCFKVRIFRLKNKISKNIGV